MNNKEVVTRHIEMDKGVEEILKDKRPKGFKYPHEDFKYVAVGYLDITEPQYEVGAVPAGFVEKLKLLYHQGGVIASLGSHQCEFCLNQGVKKLPKDALSSTEKMLTDKENKVIYIFPELIFHYILVHQYKPPDEFIEFVMRS